MPSVILSPSFLASDMSHAVKNILVCTMARTWSHADDSSHGW